MDDTRHHRPDEPHHPGDHERTDVNIRQIALFGFGMVVVGVLIHYALGWLMNLYSDRQFRIVGTTRPLSDTLSKTTQPPLQVNPAEEVKAMRAGDARRLSSYGWVDRKAGIVRIPIERAIDLTVRRGFPTRNLSSPERRGESPETKQDRGASRDQPKNHEH